MPSSPPICRTVAQRQLICGMHVHVGVPDEDLRIDLHGQLVYFLPHLLALSTSSPFWRGRSTGLKSYRTAISVELPRAGLPQTFASAAEYRRMVDLLVKLGPHRGCLKDLVGPPALGKFPDAWSCASPTSARASTTASPSPPSTIRSIQMLIALKRRNQRWRQYLPALVAENRWLAQRHGASGELIDFGRGEAVPFRDLVEELIGLIARRSGSPRLPR